MGKREEARMRGRRGGSSTIESHYVAIVLLIRSLDGTTEESTIEDGTEHTVLKYIIIIIHVYNFRGNIDIFHSLHDLLVITIRHDMT